MTGATVGVVTSPLRLRTTAWWKRVVCGALAAGLGIAVAPNVRAEAATTTSRFVSIKSEDCTLIEEDVEYAKARCGTALGWTVITEYGDLRESITLARAGVETDLGFWNLAPSSTSLGERLEFRVRSGKAIAAIVRLSYFASVADDGTFTGKRSSLIVMRLDPKPCVVGVIAPSTTQTRDAQRLADRAARTPCRPA
jgi:hypothetical protein